MSGQASRNSIRFDRVLSWNLALAMAPSAGLSFPAYTRSPSLGSVMVDSRTLCEGCRRGTKGGVFQRNYGCPFGCCARIEGCVAEHATISPPLYSEYFHWGLPWVLQALLTCGTSLFVLAILVYNGRSPKQSWILHKTRPARILSCATSYSTFCSHINPFGCSGTMDYHLYPPMMLLCC